MKIAIPCVSGKLCAHFGHCEQFAMIDANEDGSIVSQEMLTPPPHEPGLLPKWLGEKNTDVIIAGGMGMRAQMLFNEQNIKVVTGAPAAAPDEIVTQYLAGSLVTGENTCDH